MTYQKTHRHGGPDALAETSCMHHSTEHHGHHGHRSGHGPRDRHGAPVGMGQSMHAHDHHGHGPHGGPGRGRGGPSGRGGDGRRKRVFGSVELALVLLHLVDAQPRHGYDLIREIDSRTGGAYAPSPGIVYPTLASLEEAGLVAAIASDDAKRLFGITDAGRAHLAERQDALAAALAKLDAVRATASQADAGPVSRAMQNLSVVLEQRLTAAQEKQALFDLADLIDDLARRIERMP
jgi:DNA-binding PadR family transcriptional regulator